MYNNYQTINKSEIDDFKQSCQQFNLDPKNFELKEHDIKEIPAENGLFHPIGKITISLNGSSATYASGHGSKWPSEFHADLESGKFTNQ